MMPSKIHSLAKTVAALGLIASAGAAGTALAASNVAIGFGHDTTGGAGGKVVYVYTGADLARELCSETSSSCDATPRTIVVKGMIDFRGSEKSASGPGCYPYPNKKEALLLLNSADTHCDNFKMESITYDKVGKDPMRVGSNKTVIGADAHSGIMGRGLTLTHVQNVIIRNLTFTDINPSVVFAGDGIWMNDVENVWIDHNSFSLMGRQMIAAGESVDHVTISWNDFNGRTDYAPNGDGYSYWIILFGSPDHASVTIADNWFHEFSGRAPEINQKGNFHLVNNYFQFGSNFALNAGNDVNILMEGNYFEQVKTPVMTNRTNIGHIFALLSSDHEAWKSTCLANLGRDCSGNSYLGSSDLSGFHKDKEVLTAFANRSNASSMTGVQPIYLAKPYMANSVPQMVKSLAGPGHL